MNTNKLEEKLCNAPEWQRNRYEDLKNTIRAELTEDEKRYLLWLSGWDGETVVVFKNIFLKLQQGK